jgi:multidrug resistance protein, MATE family
MSSAFLQTIPMNPFSPFQPPSFLSQFLRLTLINILANLMVPLAGLLDMAFLGHLAEIHHLAGVSLAMVLFNYLYWSFGFLRMGTTGLTAQAVGRQDAEAVLLIGLRNGILAALIGLMILLLQYPLGVVGFAILRAAPDVKMAGQAFYNALIWGAPATLINFVIVGWFLGRSQSGRVLVLTAVSSGANVLFDYGFIVRLGWASMGAGLATAVSQYVMLGVAIGLLSRDVQWCQIRAVAGKLWDRSALQATFSLNGEILIRTFALVSTFAIFTNLGAMFGTVVLTSNAILMQVVTLAAYFIDGLAFATESLAGLFRGQGTAQQLRSLVQVAGGTSLLLGVLFAIAFISQPAPLFKLLTHHAAVLEYVAQYVGWLLPVLGFGSIAYMLDGYFLGLTAGRILRRSMLQAGLIGFLPVAIGAWYFQSNHGLWLALALFMAVRAITLSAQVPATLTVATREKRV